VCLKTFSEFDGAEEGLSQKSLKPAASRISDFKNYISMALISEVATKQH